MGYHTKTSLEVVGVMGNSCRGCFESSIHVVLIVVARVPNFSSGLFSMFFMDFVRHLSVTSRLELAALFIT